MYKVAGGIIVYICTVKKCSMCIIVLYLDIQYNEAGIIIHICIGTSTGTGDMYNTYF